MKFVPYDKLQKKKQRELDKKKRRDFGALNPVTRVPDNPKAYKRKKARLNDPRDGFFVARPDNQRSAKDE